MAKDVYMPALGMAQDTGTLLQWYKAPGDPVTAGEPLMQIATDKVDVDIEAPASGILAHVTATAGDEIPVGQVMALILAPGESAPKPPAAPRPAPGLAASPAPAAATLPASPVAARMAAEHGLDLGAIPAQGDRIQKADVLAYLEQRQGGDQPRPGGPLLASPKARRLAAEFGLDLAALQGSGPTGAVLAADVEAAAAAQVARAAQPPIAAAAAPPAATLSMSRTWQVMASRLAQSWSSVPHFYLVREANASRLITWRSQVQQRVTEKVTYTDLLIKLVAAALRKHPRVNASWMNGAIAANPAVNIGLAVAVDDGLLVPVIHGADGLGLSELTVRRRELVAKAQAGRLSMDDVQDGTFTISNLGMYGIDAFNAIVNPPQAAILAIGRIAERVVPVNGVPAVQPMLTLTLSCDHRVVDGARAAQFLQELAAWIEEPLALLD